MAWENIMSGTNILNRLLECVWGIQDWKRLPKNRPKAIIPRPEGFTVIEPRPLDLTGDSLLYFIKKINTTTYKAAECLKSITKARKISHSGLKDKNAITYQYMTIKHAKTPAKVMEKSECGIKAWLIKKNAKELLPGEHYWNFFHILLILEKQYNQEDPIQINEKTFPNYYGPQRFGICKPDTHISGLLLLRGYEKLAQNLQKRKKATSEKPRSTHIIKLLVQSYQSYLFNKTLSNLITEHYNNIEEIKSSEKITGRKVKLYCPNRTIFVPAGELPEPRLIRGSSKNTLWIRLLKEVIAEEDAESYVEQFPKYGLRGGIRPLVSYPCFLRIQVRESNVDIRFILPRGSYATVFLREYFELDWMSECGRQYL